MSANAEALAEVAAEARCFFEYVEKGAEDGRHSYWRCNNATPEWVGELVREAHGDFLPDDWRYGCIVAALDFIAEGQDDSAEFADEQVDVYTSNRLAWLGSNLARSGYCDEAAENGMVSSDGGIVALIGAGQYEEAGEVYGLVESALEARLAELEPANPPHPSYRP